MEADFSGWVTKAGLRCSDGRTIMPDAFKHQDGNQVPLVWQHGHSDPENVLGHVILENRDDGVYGYGFFNKSAKSGHAKELLEHKDINMMSIWANQLIERAKTVLHGAIREVSLVLAGANPGALIENVTIRHSDDDDEVLDDEAIIYTGLELEHATTPPAPPAAGNSNTSGDPTLQDVYDSLDDNQLNLLHYMVGQALAEAGASAGATNAQHDGLEIDEQEAKEVYESLTDDQKQLVHSLLDKALTGSEDDDKTNTDPGNNSNNDTKEGKEMKHNVFEGSKDGDKTGSYTLTHDDIKQIVADASTNGSLKESVKNFALSHGIDDIDVLFPDAKAITNSPELFSRRTEWVAALIGGTKKSPFSRIKTVSADITVAEARAKGYIKGNLKKEEFFRVSKRVTTPTTIYKKQKLDRDDMVDITDFDTVAWLKGEMRLMLDEELARAVLVGDGRPVDDEDKINEDAIRPIATDHEVYTTTITVPIDETNASVQAALDEIILNRKELRGSGLPTMFTTETWLARMLLLRDTTGRKLYKNVDELATDLRVNTIVAVEILEEYADLFCIMVNLNDYVLGADRGGEVNMFDDFDIDYNQYKYLIETRCSGALTKLKSALVVRAAAAGATEVTPAAPTFDGTAITITNTAGVVYRNADTDAVMNAAGSPYAVPAGTTVTVHAEPAAGNYFESTADEDWSFTNEA